ncbi:MAG TPA: hypothetical protein VHV49_06705 [Pseudonocardiaceae bacterium]|jgi:hypothetical protein|nr:hypothetical protein [Pseudonocardiaceae bacterium]
MSIARIAIPLTAAAIILAPVGALSAAHATGTPTVAAAAAGPTDTPWPDPTTQSAAAAPADTPWPDNGVPTV